VIHRLEWWLLCIPLVVGASLLPRKSATRRVLAAAVPALLGAAASAAWPAGVGYMAATTGLMIAGAALPLPAAARALRGPAPDARRSLPGALLILAGSTLIAIRAAPSVAALGLPVVAAWAVGPVVVWWLLVSAGRLVGLRRGVAWLDRVALARRPPTTLGSLPKVSRARAALLIAGAGLVFIAPHAGLVLAGMVLASVGAELTFRPRSLLPVLPLITLALLPAGWLLYTIAGPVGFELATLDQIPLSPAAARLIALPLAVVAWAWMGLWPLHGSVRPVLLAPLGAALWLRVAVPAAPDGLAHWRPLVGAAAVAGLWHAAADGRLASVLVALGFAALASRGPLSAPAAALLLAAAFAFKLPSPGGGLARAGFDAVRRLAFAGSAAGALLAFAAGLRAEVVLTVLAAGGLAFGYRAASPVNDL
jgi:hypothetical protein